MRRRLHAGKAAEITFTCDFHEIVIGELRPGRPVLLRYDPQRIVPPGEPYQFGDPDRPIIAHLQFREGAPTVSAPLRSSAGILPCPDVDLTGQGSMLSAEIIVPADSDRLIIWCSYPSASGVIRYDSDYGANYRFGFPCTEIDVLEATVVSQPDAPADRLDLTVATASTVEGVAAQFSLPADPTCTKHETSLQQTGEVGRNGSTVTWSGSADVPHGAIVRFKLFYWIGGRRLKDDNTGTCYLAPEPEPDPVSPPPRELLDAAAAWR